MWLARLEHLAGKLPTRGLRRRVLNTADLIRELDANANTTIILGDIVRDKIMTNIDADNFVGTTASGNVRTGNIHQASIGGAAPKDELTALLQKLHEEAEALHSRTVPGTNEPAVPPETADAAVDAAEEIAEEVRDGGDSARLTRRLKHFLGLAKMMGSTGAALASAITALRDALGLS
jgi:hypothetical protein